MYENSNKTHIYGSKTYFAGSVKLHATTSKTRPPTHPPFVLVDIILFGRLTEFMNKLARQLEFHTTLKLNKTSSTIYHIHLKVRLNYIHSI